VKATYRYGIGSPGNVDAGQINQLATHPGGLQGVLNPLAATGGADRDSLDQARRNAPLAVMALDRLVSIRDYADFARTYAGIGKASATLISDGRRELVHLTIAGAGDIPIDQSSDLYQNFVLSLETFGDPFQFVQVCIRKVKLLVISAAVQLEPDYDWEAVGPQIRDAVLALYSFDVRDLGQPAFLSETISTIQAVEGVLYVDVRIFDAVSEDTTVDELAKLATRLQLNSFVKADLARLNPLADPAGDPCQRIRAAELVFLTPDIPETLILTNLGA
jgi:predicted phage baseplate assembly protein